MMDLHTNIMLVKVASKLRNTAYLTDRANRRLVDPFIISVAFEKHVHFFALFFFFN